MNKLFIYYSYTGNGDFVAEILKEKEFDIRKIETIKKPLPNNFFFSMVVGGFKASVGSSPKLKEFNNNIEGYDDIYIGSPIWNGRFSTPINTVLSDLDLTGKKVSFVLYSASGEAKKAVERIEAEYPGSKYVIVKEPKKNENLKELLAEV